MSRRESVVAELENGVSVGLGTADANETLKRIRDLSENFEIFDLSGNDFARDDVMDGVISCLKVKGFGMKNIDFSNCNIGACNEVGGKKGKQARKSDDSQIVAEDDAQLQKKTKKQQLIEELRNKNLQRLNLSNNGLDGESMIVLADSLCPSSSNSRGMTTLLELDLSGNRDITLEGLKPINEALIEIFKTKKRAYLGVHPLQSPAILRLSNMNGLFSKGLTAAENLGEQFKSLIKENGEEFFLKELDLRGNQIGLEGARRILNAFSDCKTLPVVDLGGNGLLENDFRLLEKEYPHFFPENEKPKLNFDEAAPSTTPKATARAAAVNNDGCCNIL